MIRWDHERNAWIDPGQCVCRLLCGLLVILSELLVAPVVEGECGRENEGLSLAHFAPIRIGGQDPEHIILLCGIIVPRCILLKEAVQVLCGCGVGALNDGTELLKVTRVQLQSKHELNKKMAASWQWNRGEIDQTMRSASSITRNFKDHNCLKCSCPPEMTSQRRPGVPTTISGL